MIVTLKEMVAREIGTNRTTKPPMWQVLADGKLIGNLGYAENSTLFLLGQFTPSEKAEIERQVRELTKRKWLGIASPPDPKVLRGQETEDEDPFE